MHHLKGGIHTSLTFGQERQQEQAHEATKNLPAQTKGECVEKDTGSTVDDTVGATTPISALPVMTRQLPPDTPAVCNIKKAHLDSDGNVMRMRITLWCWIR